MFVRANILFKFKALFDENDFCFRGNVGNVLCGLYFVCF